MNGTSAIAFYSVSVDSKDAVQMDCSGGGGLVLSILPSSLLRGEKMYGNVCSNRTKGNLLKIMALLVVAFMAVTILPMVDADETANDTTDLQTKIDQTPSGGVLVLEKNYNLSGSVTIDKRMTLSGGDNKYSITGNGFNLINITESGVTIKNLRLDVSGNGFAINCDARVLTVTGCDIEADSRGINYYWTGSSLLLRPSLTVTGTNITNSSAESLYNVCYNTDNRGISIGNLKRGTATITDCSINGFKYGINVFIDENTSSNNPRNANGTVFDISNTEVWGWTALNIWSGNTTFNITKCNFTGVNKFSDGFNDYSTIMANDGMYTSNSTYSTKINVNGGSLTAVRYGDNLQSAVYVDVYAKTKYKFSAIGDDKVDFILNGTESYLAAAFMFQASCTVDHNQYITDTGFWDNTTTTIGLANSSS